MANNWRSEIKELDTITPDEVEMWNRLCAENDHLRSPFFTFTFFSCVAKARPDARVCLLYHGSNLVGFFPFQFESPIARALGAGERIGGLLSDFSGIISGPISDFSHTDLLHCARLHYFSVSHLQTSQKSWGLAGQSDHLGYSIKLDQNLDDYWSLVSDRDKAKLKILMKRELRIERDFKKATFVFNESNPLPILDLVMAEKRAQYTRTAVDDVLQQAWIQKCLREIAAQNNELCCPVVSSLYLDDEWAALHFGIRSHGVLHYWFPVYNPRFANLGPGLILLRKMINQGKDFGIKEIDLGEGNAPYKIWLGTHEYANSSGEWLHPGIQSFMYKAYLSASWRLKAILKPSPIVAGQ